LPGVPGASSGCPSACVRSSHVRSGSTTPRRGEHARSHARGGSAPGHVAQGAEPLLFARPGRARARPFASAREGLAPRRAVPARGECGRRHPEPDVVVPVVRGVVVAVGTAGVPRGVVEVAATHHPALVSSPRHQRSRGRPRAAMRRSPRRRLLPSSQQPADLRHHRGHVLVLAARQPAPPGGQPQVRLLSRSRRSNAASSSRRAVTGTLRSGLAVRAPGMRRPFPGTTPQARS
jgi:hypothetical protein